jgi:hypothetical protein
MTIKQFLDAAALISLGLFLGIVVALFAVASVG